MHTFAVSALVVCAAHGKRATAEDVIHRQYLKTVSKDWLAPLLLTAVLADQVSFLAHLSSWGPLVQLSGTTAAGWQTLAITIKELHSSCSCIWHVAGSATFEVLSAMQFQKGKD